MKPPSTFFPLLFTAALAVFAAGTVVTLRAAPTEPKAAIVLIHGAFADGSSWRKVIPLLEKEGYAVTAVQDPMTSLDDDVAATRRVIEAQKGPVILVGHSYGGAVITEAAAGLPQVRALVYIAAFAPDIGEAVGPMQAPFAPSALGSALVSDTAGFLSIERARFHEVFARDVTPAEALVLAATQMPIFSGCFSAPLTSAAWHKLPSWYLVASDDEAINPELERFMARRIGATTIEVKSSHVPFLTQPGIVARLITQAAQSVTP